MTKNQKRGREKKESQGGMWGEGKVKSINMQPARGKRLGCLHEPQTAMK